MYSPVSLHSAVREHFIVIRENRLRIKVVVKLTNLLREKERQDNESIVMYIICTCMSVSLCNKVNLGTMACYTTSNSFSIVYL